MGLKNLKRQSHAKASVPVAPRPSVPDASRGDGVIMHAAGKYARAAVLGVFHQLGGEDGMAAWARENETDFYTKLFPKIITKEVEDVQAADSLEKLLSRLDDEDDVIDVEAEDV